MSPYPHPRDPSPTEFGLPVSDAKDSTIPKVVREYRDGLDAHFELRELYATSAADPDADPAKADLTFVDAVNNPAYGSLVTEMEPDKPEGWTMAGAQPPGPVDSNTGLSIPFPDPDVAPWDATKDREPGEAFDG